MKIFLIGYMCSGKTTLGIYLAKKLKLRFIDLDEYIVEKENLSVNKIFEERGEANFRQLEYTYLQDLIACDNVIIATGGGTPCFNNNIARINENGFSIYLKTCSNVLVERLLVMGANRPLVKGKSREELNKYVTSQLKEREVYYNKAKLSVDCNIWDVERISNEIISLLFQDSSL